MQQNNLQATENLPEKSGIGNPARLFFLDHLRSALVILVAMGYRYLSGRLFPVLGASMVLFTFAANLICLFGALLPAYAPSI